ncbi:hypothetical protein BY996DRAFT_6584210, partial [Phakopsora pachyrhizi]
MSEDSFCLVTDGSIFVISMLVSIISLSLFLLVKLSRAIAKNEEEEEEEGEEEEEEEEDLFQ